MKIKICFLIILATGSCLNPEKTDKNTGRTENSTNTPIPQVSKKTQEAIVEKHLVQGAWKYPIYSQEWQREIDKGLTKDSTIAYLWQQKAMPLIKQGKYEVGIAYLDQAVKYNRQKWQDYRAFTKCIFAKTYKESILDFENYKKEYGYGFVMDHSYDFYIGLSYLQLNDFQKAEEVFKTDYDNVVSTKGKGWLHHLDLFYYGISKYELNKYEEAIELFDLALEKYPQFSDVQVYKAVCLRKLGRSEEAKIYDELAEFNGRKGYSINEANSIYERYPYQMRWR